jgi:flagellar hook-length control protein FliK
VLRTATTPIAKADAPAPTRPAVHTPIVTAIAPLVQRGDGSYHLSVRLHPEELGAIELDVELRGGEINLRMRPESDAGREAIRAALPALRSELEAAGVRSGTFDLGERPSGQAPEERRQPMPTPRHEPLPESVSDPLDDVDGDAALDVRL